MSTVFKSAELSRVDETERTTGFVASTGRKDRYGDIVDPHGWDLDAFRRNPVLLFGHRTSQLPVGRVEQIGVQNDRLEASLVRFLPAGVDEFADKVWQFVQRGFLRSVSVGFLPITRSSILDADGKHTGWLFSQQELVELSVVPVPANPEAVSLAKSLAFKSSDLDRLFCDRGVPAAVRLAQARVNLLRARAGASHHPS